MPTVTLRFPSNMAAGPGHNWANAISMATPIAHKGIQVGAKVVALTVIDFLMKPELVTQAWDYFNNVQTKTTKYMPLIRPDDKPAIWLNKETMAKYRPEMKKYYYDPTQVQELPGTARDFLSDGTNRHEEINVKYGKEISREQDTGVRRRAGRFVRVRLGGTGGGACRTARADVSPRTSRPSSTRAVSSAIGRRCLRRCRSSATTTPGRGPGRSNSVSLPAPCLRGDPTSRTASSRTIPG